MDKGNFSWRHTKCVIEVDGKTIHCYPNSEWALVNGDPLNQIPFKAVIVRTTESDEEWLRKVKKG